MATFRHKRYPGLVLHDGEAEWGRFTDGTLETSDEDTIARLRAAAELDEDLVEDESAPEETGDTGDHGVPDGNADAVLTWVGDQAGRARQALEAERAKGDKARGTLVAKLEKLAG